MARQARFKLMRLHKWLGKKLLRFLLILASSAFSATALLGQETDGLEGPAPRAQIVEDLGPKFDEDGMAKSSSGQFFVNGGDASQRGIAANLAEEVKDELKRLLESNDDWSVPVHVELRGRKGDEVPLRATAIRVTGNDSGYRVHVLVNLSLGLKPGPLRRAIYSGLVYSNGLEDQTPSKDQLSLSVAPWIVEGLMEASAWRMKQADRKLYDALFRHGGVYGLDNLLETSEADFEQVDAASRAAFRVSAGALVMALLEQPNGKEGFRDLLNEVALFQGEMPALLRRHFPDLNLSESSMAKWWALELANKGMAPLTDAYSIQQTEKLLEGALKLRYQDGDGVLQEIGLEQWEQIEELGEGQRAESVRIAQDDLLRLSYRCFPSYRPLLSEYQEVLNQIAQGKTGDIGTTLVELDEVRQLMVGKMGRARDFLDYFEITRARETSGAFEDYLRLKERLKTRPQRKKDAMSSYLDRLAPLFQPPEEVGPGNSLRNDETFGPGFYSEQMENGSALPPF